MQAIPPQTKIILVAAMIKGRVHRTRKVMEVLEIKMARRDLTKEKYSATTVKNGAVMLMNVDMAMEVKREKMMMRLIWHRMTLIQIQNQWC